MGAGGGTVGSKQRASVSFAGVTRPNCWVLRHQSRNGRIVACGHWALDVPERLSYCANGRRNASLNFAGSDIFGQQLEYGLLHVGYYLARWMVAAGAGEDEVRVFTAAKQQSSSRKA